MRLSGLGRGLESLIPRKDSSSLHQNQDLNEDLKRRESVFLIELDKIKENPQQPRRNFSQEELNTLAQSIREYGILQPLIVTKSETEGSSGIKVSYELVAGERRLRAARLAGLSSVPVIIRQQKTLDKQKLEIALIENIHRANLNPIERACAFAKLANDFGLTQKEIADKVGHSRESVTNTMRLLQLPQDIQQACVEGSITEGHARAILAVEGENAQRAMLKEILGKSLSVRAAEFLGRHIKGVKKQTQSSDPVIKEYESRLEEFFGTRVKLAKTGSKGRILIEFYSPEELNAILDKILRS